MNIFELRTYLVKRGMETKSIDSLVKFPYLDQYDNLQDFTSSFAGLFLMKHPKNRKTVEYVHEALGKKRLEWSDFTSVNLTAVKAYMKDKVSSNSLRTYFAQIKAVIQPYVDDNIVPCKDTGKILQARKTPADKIALSAKEVEAMWNFRHQLHNYKPRFADIWRDFMLCTYLGCRHSDLEVISENNITHHLDMDGNDVGIVEYTSIKTKVKAYPPLHPNVLTLLKMPTSGNKYDNCATERVLKRIGKDIGMTQEKTLFTCGKRKTLPKYEFMSSHVARHTYVTLLAGGKNPVNITEIAKYCGHSDTAMTMSYIVRDEMPFTSNVMANFSF